MTTTIEHQLNADWLAMTQATVRRNGPIELCPDPECYDNDFCQLNIHKVRLLHIHEGRWIVERPFATNGQPAITRDMNLVGILGSGSQRWSFRSTVEAALSFQLNRTQRVPALRLSAPHDIQSAQRRAFFRISVLASDIPDITCWPLLDLSSSIDSEIANEHLHRDGAPPSPMPRPPSTDTPFTASLNDISGNGLSCVVDDDNMARLEKNPLLWLKLVLPDIPHPLMMVGRYIRHQLDPRGRHLVGIAFQYRHHRPHEKFICDHICRFAAAEQRRQLQRTR